MPIKRYSGSAFPEPPDYFDVMATLVSDGSTKHELEIIVASEEDDQRIDLDVTSSIEPVELNGKFGGNHHGLPAPTWKIVKKDILAPGETQPFVRQVILPNGTVGHADAQLRVEIAIKTRTFGRSYSGYILVKPPRLP